MKHLWNMLLIPSLLLLCNCANFKKIQLPNGPQTDAVTNNYWIAEYSEKSGLNYVITFPKEYGDDTTKKWPLVIFLHSMAERGDDIYLVINNPTGEGNGIAPFALKKENLKFITVSPLCPANAYWPLINDRLNTLLKDLTSKYQIQQSQVYLTGVSMGGMGVWSFAMEYPNWFAAIAPISGGIYFPPMIENIQAIKRMPIWAFHDRYDPEIPMSKEQDTIRRLQQINPSVIYTVLEEGKHYIHQEIYENDRLFDWFLSFGN